MQFSYSGVKCIGVSRSCGENALSCFWALALVKNVGRRGVLGRLDKISL